MDPAAARGLAGFSGLVYYELVFWLYLNGLRRASASEAGLFVNLVPVLALGGAYGLLGESLRLIQWLGHAWVGLAGGDVARVKTKPTNAANSR